jgi:hypothetical protein
VTVVLPSTLLNEAGDYVMFYASENEMVTALPIWLQVIE